MLALPDHILFVVLALLGPVWGSTMGFRRLKRAPDIHLPRVRQSVYRTAIAAQWSIAAATALWWATAHRPWSALGVVPKPTFGLLGVALGFVIVVVIVIRQRAQVMLDDDALADVRRKLAHLERMMPRSPADMRTFYLLSLTAGVCEELLYRGFLVWYLAHGFGLIQSVGLAALIFGFGHSYQGPRGVLLTGIVGLFLGLVYLITGSLLVPIVIHALMDAHSGSLAYAAFTRGDTEAAEDAERHARALAEAATAETAGTIREEAGDAPNSVAMDAEEETARGTWA